MKIRLAYQVLDTGAPPPRPLGIHHHPEPFLESEGAEGGVLHLPSVVFRHGVKAEFMELVQRRHVQHYFFPPWYSAPLTSP